MNSAKKYQMKDGWKADKVSQAACEELDRLERLGHLPGFCIIEFDADEGNTTNDKKHLFVGFYHDEEGTACSYTRDYEGRMKHFHPTTHELLKYFLDKGATVIVDEYFWGSHTHIAFFNMLGWDMMKNYADGLDGLDPQMKKA